MERFNRTIKKEKRFMEVILSEFVRKFFKGMMKHGYCLEDEIKVAFHSSSPTLFYTWHSIFLSFVGISHYI